MKLKLKQTIKTTKVTLDEWKYLEIKVLHQVDDNQEVIAGFRRKVEKKIERLDFIRIIDLCWKYKIINNIKLKNDISRVRELRNKLHLGGLLKVERVYSKKDLEFCFNVVKRLRKILE